MDTSGNGLYDVDLEDGSPSLKEVDSSKIFKKEHSMWLHRCFDCFKYLILRDKEKQLSIENMYFKNSFLIASEFGKYEIVKWILENSENPEKVASTFRTTDKNSALMYACAGGTQDHLQIVKLLIEYNTSVNVRNKYCMTPLLWAVEGGNVDIVKILLEKIKSTVDGHKTFDEKSRPLGSSNYRTALMQAAEKGKYEICESLVEGLKVVELHEENREQYHERMGRMWALDSEDGKKNDTSMNAMQIALKYGRVTLATELFMVTLDGEGNERSMLSAFTNDVFANQNDIVDIAKRYGNVAESAQPLHELMDYAVRYDFHFDFFISLIPHFPSPLSALNEALPRLFNLFSTDARGCDLNILYRMVRLYSAIELARASHPLEETDLDTFIERLGN